MFISKELKCEPSAEVNVGYVMKTCMMCGNTFMVPMETSLSVVDCCDDEKCVAEYNSIMDVNKAEQATNDATQAEVDKAIGK